MTVKTLIALFCVLPGSLAAQQAAAPAPVSVENEPLHHVVLKNDSVLVLHLTLPPGERTQFHIHSHDRVAIDLSTTSITQQTLNEPESPSSTTKPGDISAYAISEGPITHRVHNVGKVAFDVLDVELFQRPQTPSSSVAASVAAENPSARVYKWVLGPGATSGMHTHKRPYLIVSATALNLKMTAPGGESMSHELKPGEFHWVDTEVTHELVNAGSAEGQILEVELK
ncbi:MAG: hypothetical protein PVS2B2_13620 [Candidatus Acidiferrum sp.]